MESVVDVVRMQILSNASNKSKNQWQYLILLAVLGNYRRLWEQFIAILTQLSSVPFFKKFIKARQVPKKIEALPEKKPRTVIKLKFSKGELDNKILKEIINRHSIEFDTVQLKNPNTWHVIQPKTITLGDDIFFRLDFNEKPPPPQHAKTKKKKKKDGEDDSDDDEDAPQHTPPPVTEVELPDTRGQIYSYGRPLKEVLDFIHEKYVPVEPEPVVVKKVTPITKKTLLHSMFVGRATKFNDKNELCGEILEFTVSKTLDNLFLERGVKDLLFSQIDKFNDPNWYAERGLPRTLGILLYGEPGCGKTSFIKTMCSHMKRRVLIVDFKLVKTVTQLRNIFSGNFNVDKENGDVFRFTKDNTIFVFEDFDCMSDVFMDRHLKKKDEKKEEEESEKDKEFHREMMKLRALEKIELLKQGRKKKSKKERKRALAQMKMDKFDNKTIATTETVVPTTEEVLKGAESDDSDEMHPMFALTDLDDPWTGGAVGDGDFYGGGLGKYDWKKWGYSWKGTKQITLADFLELLDGIIEMDGRIIIMTTNQREKMDSALVRPGRIDLDLELCAPSRPLVAEIFAHMYQHVPLDDLKELFRANFENIPNKLVSTARVINCFMYNKPEQGIKALIESGRLKLQGDSENAIDIRKLFMEQSSDMEFDQVWDTVENIYAVDADKPDLPSEGAIDIWDVLKNVSKPIFTSVSSIGAGGQWLSVLDINGKVDNYLETNFSRGGIQWYQMNFKQHRVKPMRIGIRKHPTSKYTLYNWDFQASDNEEDDDYEVIASYRNDRSLVDNDYVIFNVPCTKFYKYLKIQSIGPSWHIDGNPRDAHFSLVTMHIIGEIILVE